MRKANLKIRSKRALSPIFATLIILAIVTVLFIPVFIWATGISSQTQDSWQLSGQIATERIVIEEVNLRGQTPQNCTIYVRNIGETAVTINDAIIESDGSVHAYQGTQISTFEPGTNVPLTSIIKGDLIEIRIPNLGSLTVVNGKTYMIKVFTTRGVSDAYQVQAIWTP